MQRRTFLQTGAAALAPWLVRPRRGIFAQDPPTAATAKPASLRPPSTKPTPPEKIKQLKSMPANVAAQAQDWRYREGIDGERINGEIAGFENDVVTLYDRDGFYDVVPAELTDEDQAAISRFRRLLANKPIGDERKLLGSWKVVPTESPGTERLGKGVERITINSLQLQMRGDSGCYLLDSTKSPKWIDVSGMKGIYEIQGTKLRLCLNGLTEIRPAKFEHREGLNVLVAHRLPDVSTLPVPPASQYEPELRSFFEELIRLLEAEDYAGFLKRSLAPGFFAEVPSEKLSTMTAAMTVHKQIASAGMHALLRVVPKMSSNSSVAEFDFSGVHADGISPLTTVATMKFDGRWYSKL